MTRISIAVMCWLLLGFEHLQAEELFMEPSRSEWDGLLSGFTAPGSPTWYATMFLIVQSLFLVFRTALGDILGIYKLLVLASLSLLVTIGTNLLAGKSVFESLLLDSGTLMAFQVLAHQVKAQWKKRHEDRIHYCDSCPERLRDGIT